MIFLATSLNAFGQIVYKIPDGGFPMNWSESGFKGMLFLQKESPSGIFIAFPDEGETLDQLRERAAKFIAPMVVHDTKEMATIPFETKTIESAKNDVEGRGRYYFYKGQKSQIQILFFERKTPASNVLYGYFAQRGNEDSKSKTWVGEDMKRPKILNKFEGSFYTK